MKEFLRISKWAEYQSYRRDRGQPPWIKVHRKIMRNTGWVEMTDTERGQLIAMWLLAADRDGIIPSDPAMVQKLCFMSSPPDMQRFKMLEFLEDDANVTPT